MSINNGYATGNLLDYEYFSHHKLITIDLRKQIELENLELKQQLILLVKIIDNW